MKNQFSSEELKLAELAIEGFKNMEEWTIPPLNPMPLPTLIPFRFTTPTEDFDTSKEVLDNLPREHIIKYLLEKTKV